MNEEEHANEMAKVARLATNEAKNAIIEWADRFEDERDCIGIAIIASTNVAKGMIDAAMGLEDRGIAEATLHQIDTLLMPLIDQLRAKLAKQETKH